MDIHQDVHDLLVNLGPGHMRNTVYDTAWLTHLRDIDRELSAAAIDWICENQLADGSWGTDTPFYYHDRVICTLAAMIALARKGRRARDQRQIERGQQALEHIASGATKGLMADPNGATVGFEMIVPTLLAEAEALGVLRNQNQRILGRLSQQRNTKMALLKGRMINRFVTVAFSAEMAGSDGLRLFDVENLQEVNGSVGHSPSATAYYLLNICPEDSKALQYLNNVTNQGGVPDLLPFDIFDRVWVLWNLAIAGPLTAETIALCQPHLDHLQKAWTPGKGLSFSVGYTPKDADNTIVGYELFLRLARQGDIDAVLSYEEESHFRCYPFEAHPSIGVNIHALSALREARFDIQHPSVQKLVNFLRRTKISDAFWFDKWHISPYYATAHAIIASAGYVDNLVANSVEWMLTNQNEDGSWGFYIPTAEETAFCLQALFVWQRSGKAVPKDCLKKGTAWLKDHLESPRPALWLGKCLYFPDLIVQSTILSALLLADQSNLT